MKSAFLGRGKEKKKRKRRQPHLVLTEKVGAQKGVSRELFKEKKKRREPVELVKRSE